MQGKLAKGYCNRGQGQKLSVILTQFLYKEDEQISRHSNFDKNTLESAQFQSPDEGPSESPARSQTGFRKLDY